MYIWPFRAVKQKRPFFLAREQIKMVVSEPRGGEYRPTFGMLTRAGMRIGKLIDPEYDVIDFGQEKTSIVDGSTKNTVFTRRSREFLV